MNMNQNTMITCVAALFGATLVAVSAIAQGVDVAAPGATIRVGPDKGAGGGGAEVQAPGVTVRTPADDPSTPAEESVIQVPATPKRYLIGIAGGDISPELRMHLGLDGVGVIVRDVTPGGAAATAGIQKHDVLLSADGAPLASIQDLASAVRAAGPEERPIAVELIRRGKTTTVDVTPVEQEVPPRAAPVDGGAGAFGEGGFGERRFGNGAFGAAPGGDQQFGFGGRQPFQFRMFGPGVAIGGMGNAQVQANGISVQLQSQNGQSVVKAQKGDQTWEFDARDQQAIAQLPPDVRQMV
ncbi:MAG: PDZ domain-containing protein, partial [Planctomycetota bacterium]